MNNYSNYNLSNELSSTNQQNPFGPSANEDDTVKVPSIRGRRVIPKLRMFEAKCRIAQITEDGANFVKLLSKQDPELKQRVEGYFNQTNGQESSYEKVKIYLMDHQIIPINDHLQNRIKATNLRKNNLVDLANQIQQELANTTITYSKIAR